MKLPAAKGIKKVMIFCVYPYSKKEITTPSIEVSAVKKLSNNALFLEYQPCTSTQKFPISCGISWNTTAKVVAIPTGMLTR